MIVVPGGLRFYLRAIPVLRVLEGGEATLHVGWPVETGCENENDERGDQRDA